MTDNSVTRNTSYLLDSIAIAQMELSGARHFPVGGFFDFFSRFGDVVRERLDVPASGQRMGSSVVYRLARLAIGYSLKSLLRFYARCYNTSSAVAVSGTSW